MIVEAVMRSNGTGLAVVVAMEAQAWVCVTAAICIDLSCASGMI